RIEVVMGPEVQIKERLSPANARRTGRNVCAASAFLRLRRVNPPGHIGFRVHTFEKRQNHSSSISFEKNNGEQIFLDFPVHKLFVFEGLSAKLSLETSTNSIKCRLLRYNTWHSNTPQIDQRCCLSDLC